ncbi:MAG: lactate racemase domain-containing protein [Planctomycetota bacterium]
MTTVHLAWGQGTRTVDLPQGVSVVDVSPRPVAASAAPLATVARALDAPVGAAPLAEVARGARSVAIVVPDPTRPAPASVYLLPVFSRLARAGIGPDRLRVVVARGIHPAAPRDDVAALVGADVMRTLKPIQSAPDTPELNETLFEDDRLGPVAVHRVVASADHVVLTGVVTRHHLAGHGGGAKSLVPGVADRATVLAAHRLTLDALVKPDGSLRPARPDGPQPFRDALRAIATRFGRVSMLGIVPSDDGGIAEAVAGDVVTAHDEAIRRYETRHAEAHAAEPADLVLVGTPAPRDGDLVQAHKALLAASRFAAPGAPIVWLARAPRGAGHPELLPWFESGSLSRHLAALRERFHPYGLTAYSLRRLAADHPVHIVSEMGRDILRPMGLLAFGDAQKALEHALGEAQRAGREVRRVAVLSRG